MNLSDVVKALADELHDRTKYVIVATDPTKHKEEVTKLVKEKVLELEEKDLITAKDRELITGLNNNIKMKHNLEFRSVDPTIYPNFKAHKLNKGQLAAKVIPPARYVNNTKFGSLYRVEKWMSPTLTNISRSYCEREFLLDTNDFLTQIDEFNNSLKNMKKCERPKFHLCTLDVKALYPSIKPDIALESRIS